MFCIVSKQRFVFFFSCRWHGQSPTTALSEGHVAESTVVAIGHVPELAPLYALSSNYATRAPAKMCFTLRMDIAAEELTRKSHVQKRRRLSK